MHSVSVASRLPCSVVLCWFVTGCQLIIGIEDTHVESAGVDGGANGDSNLSPVLDFLGFAEWSQDVITQTDAEQDARMDAACASTFSGGRSAEVSDITFGRIASMPTSNTSSRFLLAKCPDCEGDSNVDALDGHSRVCVPPGDSWPTALPWLAFTDCTTLTRSAMCVSDKL